MGIWDELQSSVLRLINRKALSKRQSADGNATTFKGDSATAFVSSVTKVADAVKSNGSQKLDEYFPEFHRRDKIGRILTNLGKLAVDSAVNEPLKGVTGGVQVFKIVKEGLKDQPSSYPSNEIKKQDLMEEMQAKLEKMQEDVNLLKQQNQISAEYSQDLDPSKECSDEPVKSSASTRAGQKKVFIRSRM